MPKNRQLDVVKTGKDDLLEWKYLRVLILRAQGLRYAEIAKAVGVTEGSVQRWFMRGGKLHQPFSRFNDMAKGQSKEDVLTIIMGNLPEIARTLVTTAKIPYDMTGAMVGTKLLEWGIGKPGEKGTGAQGGDQLSYAEYVKKQTIDDQEEEQKNADTELQNKPETTDPVST